MLRTLLESQTVQARRTGGTLVSVGVHTAAIALVIVTTARATSAPPPSPPKPAPVTWVEPIIADQVPPPPGQHNIGILRPIVPDWRLLIAPTKIPTELPPIDASRSPIDEHSFDWARLRPDSGPAGGLASPTNALYTVTQVEKAASPRPGNPAPVYPVALRSAQIEGSVVARFVVDTTGLAEPESITFPEATHAQFADAVRQSLLHSRYLPAMLGDRRVRQLVEQRFAFTLTR
jgi:protein TonB